MSVEKTFTNRLFILSNNIMDSAEAWEQIRPEELDMYNWLIALGNMTALEYLMSKAEMEETGEDMSEICELEKAKDFEEAIRKVNYWSRKKYGHEDKEFI